MKSVKVQGPQVFSVDDLVVANWTFLGIDTSFQNSINTIVTQNMATFQTHHLCTFTSSFKTDWALES